MIIFDKNVLLSAYKNVVEKGLMDKDFIIVKLQNHVDDGDITETEATEIVNILNPIEAPIAE